MGNPLKRFLNEICHVASSIVDDSEIAIVGNSFELYANLVVTKKNTSWKSRYLMQEYLSWLSDNDDWIGAKAESVFDFDGKLFRKFIREHSLKYNGRVNILTGRYIK